jgi:ankyrin repeat protein
MATTYEDALEVVRTGDASRLAGLLAADPTLAEARSENGLSLLIQACYHRKPELVDMLRAARTSLDLFEAASVAGAEDRGAELLAADPALATAWSGDGFTALHLAAFFDREPMARLLLERGADRDAVARNPMSVRPLHSAAASRSGAIVALLLDRGADVNAQQAGGWTALHAAAMFGDLPMVERLLDRGAEAGRANDQGKTALDLAVEKGHTEVAAVLRGRTAG